MKQNSFYNFFKTATKWTTIILLVAFVAGSSSAIFLISLDWVGDFRENNIWIISMLPLAGFFIAWVYFKYGESVVKGNNQVLDEIKNPRNIIHWKMAPFVLFGTLITHLFGGSAGREGTAIQMSSALVDQFSLLFNLDKKERKILLIIAISAGFASVFGTPLAGAVFSLELIRRAKINYNAIVPSFLVAFLASFVTDHIWKVNHAHYEIGIIPNISFINVFYVILAGVFFGLGSILFTKSMHFFTHIFKTYISYPPYRTLIGGIVVAVFVFSTNDTKYIGLGIPTIVDAFSENLPYYDFLIKILLTAITLSAGFKGGEVTPLFFIGATLGNALSLFIPLPIGLLAGMGFVALFAGSTNTPLACILMGLELFGIEGTLYFGIACLIAYYISGNATIYESQFDNER
jgi:H+/Cl- antiporter ClcA